MPPTAIPQAPAVTGYDWRVAEPFMLRVAGLPYDTAAGLRFAGTAAWAQAVLAAEGEAVAARDTLADPLAAAVGRCTDEATRRLLIGLRRDVFNLRAVRPGPALDAATAALGAEDAATLACLAENARRRRDLMAVGEQTVAGELRERRDSLRALAREPRLRLGLQLSSPSLDRYADRYLDETGERLGKRARRVERSLLEYLLRTACKTSPFSTLTSVCVGTFRDGAGAAVTARIGGLRSAVRLNMAVPARLSAAVLADPRLRADLPVRATGGRQEHEDLVRYLRRTQVPGDGGDPAAKVDPLRETLFYLPAGAMLSEVVAEVSGDGTVRVRDLVARLTEFVRARTAPEPGAAGQVEADVERYVGHLLRLGFLETPDLWLDIHDPDPLERYRSGLVAVDRPWARSLADRLATLAGFVDRFGTAGLDERRALLGSIRDEVLAAQTGLGVAEPAAPGTLVYEDTAPRSAEVAADTAIWERALLPDLRRLSRVMPAFDTSVLRRIVTRGYFHIRHGKGGRCEDFLTFAHEFHRDFFDNFHQRLMRHQRFTDDGAYAPHDNWFRQPELSAVDEARKEVADRIADAYRTLPDGCAELVLEEDFTDQIAGLLPADFGALQPRSFFLQPADDGAGGPTAVVNRVYSGLTLLFSRFAHLFGDGHGDLADRMRQVLRSVRPPGAVFAELKGGYDATNLNLHPAVTDYEIVCPGEVSGRPAAARIGVEDLEVHDDTGRDRLVLRSKRLGVEVIPVYLGFLLPGALPEVQQVLLNFSYTGMAQLDLWAGTGVPEPGEDVVHLPRIRYGSVVLSRRQWSVRADRVPQRRPDQGDAAWFLEWSRWRRDHGVPRLVFLSARASGEYKPLYVDFDSYLCLTLVDAVVRDSTGVLVFTEMLPGPEQLWRDEDGRPYVTELTLEIDGVRTEAS